MGEPALKLPKIDRLKAEAEAEWKLLYETQHEARIAVQLHRRVLGDILFRLRREVERQFAKPASTGGRPKDVWWEWFAEWQPGTMRNHITRDEATRAMQIAGATDPDETDKALRRRDRERQQTSRTKRRLSRVTDDGVTRESPPPIVSLQVRQIEGMIRKLSPEDQGALFNRIKDLLP